MSWGYVGGRWRGAGIGVNGSSNIGGKGIRIRVQSIHEQYIFSKDYRLSKVGEFPISTGASNRQCLDARRLDLADDKGVRKRKFGECRDIEHSAFTLNGWKSRGGGERLLLPPAVGNESENE